MKFYKQIPNLLTLTNLLLGCIGILYCFDERYFILEKNGGLFQTFEISNRLFTAGYCIMIAAVIDFLDGFVARALNAKSAIGGQLDSLADMVTFGVLPGIIYYQLLERAYFFQEASLHNSKIWMIPALLIPIAACWRLAKFNIDTRQTTSFIGLPSPANALFAASLPLIYMSNAFGLRELMINKYVLYGLVIVFSYLMVSGIPMFSLKMKSFKWKGNEAVFSFLALALIVVAGMVVTTGIQYWYAWLGAGVAAVIVLYVLFSVTLSFFPKPENTEA